MLVTSEENDWVLKLLVNSLVKQTLILISLLEAQLSPPVPFPPGVSEVTKLLPELVSKMEKLRSLPWK